MGSDGSIKGRQKKKKKDWRRFIYCEQLRRFIKGLVEQKFPDDPASAEQAEAYIYSELEEKDYSDYRGEASEVTYLKPAVNRAAVDFHRQLYGRQRPPAWLARKGPLWVALWKAYCLERLDLETLIKKYQQSASTSGEYVREIIRDIRARLPWCGVSTIPTSLGDSDGSVSQDLAIHTDDEQERIRSDAMAFATALLVNAEGEPDAELESRFIALSELELSPDEKLLLRMRFVDGYTYTGIEKAMGLKKGQAVRLIEAVVKKLRDLWLG